MTELFSFGINKEGALGLGRNNNVSLPTPIPNLTKNKTFIIHTNCEKTTARDHIYFWSFEKNVCGQLSKHHFQKFQIYQLDFIIHYS